MVASRGGRAARGGRGGARGGRGRGNEVANRSTTNGGFGSSRPSLSLNERFTQLSSSSITTFRAVLTSDTTSKFSRNNGSKPKVSGRGGRVQGRGGKGAGGNNVRRNSGFKAKKLSKEQLDMQLDEIMGRDPKETQRTRLDEDMDTYWESSASRKDSVQVPISI